MDSILTSIKKLLGIADEYEQFDTDIIMFINSAFSVLTQLGVGNESGFAITGKTETWDDYLSGSELVKEQLEMVKTYVYLKVRVAFDPPSSSFVLEAFNKQISELEWRINVVVDPEKE